MTGRYDDEQLVDKALATLSVANKIEADAQWRDIVETVREHFHKDERAVANDLQRLSKLMESRSSVEDALTFKQRACETMLVLGMEERHRARMASPKLVQSDTRTSQPPVQPTGKLTPIQVVGTSKFREDLEFYRQTLDCHEVWQRGQADHSYALLERSAEFKILLVSTKNQFNEVGYLSDSINSQVAEWENKGIESSETLELPCGPAQRFTSPGGNHFLLLRLPV